MGQGDPVADSRALARLAILDRLAYRLTVLCPDLMRAYQDVDELVNHRPAVRGGKARNDLFGTQDFGEIHISLAKPSALLCMTYESPRTMP